MSFQDGEAYNVDYAFTDEQLSGIQPEEIVEWMCVKAFGIQTLGQMTIQCRDAPHPLHSTRRQSHFLCLTR